MAARKSIRAKTSRPIISRVGDINAWGGYLHVMADRSKAGDGHRQTLISLDLKGVLTEAVRGVTAFELRVVPEESPGCGNAEIACVGVFSSAKPALAGSVYVSRREFDLLTALSGSGKLKFVAFDFQQPHYGSALISSVSFSSEALE